MWGAPSNSGETETVVRWSPCSCAPPTRSTSPAPSTRAKSTMHDPYPNPRSGTARHLQLRVSSTSPTPDEARAGQGPPPQLPVPSNPRLRNLTPASTSSTNPLSPTNTRRPPHCKPRQGRTPKAQTSLGSWSKPSAERTSPNRDRSWTWRGTSITPTGNGGGATTTRRRPRCMPSPTTEWMVASGCKSVWDPDGG